MFEWAGDSHWRQAVAWLVRSAIIVALALAAYVVLMYVLLPAVLRR